MNLRQTSVGVLFLAGCGTAIWLLVGDMFTRVLVVPGGLSPTTGSHEENWTLPFEPATVTLAPAKTVADLKPQLERLTILMNGRFCADNDYAPYGAQPAAVLELRGDEAEWLRLFVDAGDSPAVFNQNLEAWRATSSCDMARTCRSAVLFSHFHTFAAPDNAPAGAAWPDGLPLLREAFGPGPWLVPDLPELCARNMINPAWAPFGPCEQGATAVKPGVSSVPWPGGAGNDRVHLVTYPTAPPDPHIPFEQHETVVAVAAGDGGYLVYSVCSHIHGTPAEQAPPFHAAYVVKEAMDKGELPAGPIHTIVTGTCGMVRQFGLSGGIDRDGNWDGARFMQRLEAMRDELGIRRVYLTHCALMGERGSAVHAMFGKVFGNGLRLAYPGTVIPLQ